MKDDVGYSQSLHWRFGEEPLSQPFYFASDFFPDPLLTKLEELADLQDGWRFGEGIPPRPTAIHTAQEIYQRLAGFRLKADAFPGIDGSLSLVFYAAERCVEIDISQDGKLTLSVEEGEGFDFEEIKTVPNATIFDVMKQVSLLTQKSQLWNSSGSSIHANTIVRKNASAVNALPIPATGQEYHWSMWNASENTARPYVDTSNDITQPS